MPLRGWTLPGVMSIGAAQIALKASGLLPTGNVVLAGTGPLLYMFAAQLLQAGGKVSALLDTTPGANYTKASSRLISFLFSPYALKGLSLLLKVRKSVPVYSGVTDIAIEGKGEAEAICFFAKGKTHRLSVDSVFLHQGVIPNNNLANASGCARFGTTARNAFNRSSPATGVRLLRPSTLRVTAVASAVHWLLSRAGGLRRLRPVRISFRNSQRRWRQKSQSCRGKCDASNAVDPLSMRFICLHRHFAHRRTETRLSAGAKK